MMMEKEEAKAKSEAERNKTWIHYNMLMFARPSFGEESAEQKKARSQFERMLRPKNQDKAGASPLGAPPEKLEWDFKLMEKFKKQQKGG
ncbi:hypothetical protein [Domibacillus enclensis]|nr:hypothetical protein [Domibacillus enclensis]